MLKDLLPKKLFLRLWVRISQGINFNEIIVLNNKSGKPYIILKGETKKILSKKIKRKKTKISLSLSDEKKYAVAFVTISI